MKLNYFTLILCAFLSSCDMIEYHPYDTDIKGDKDINERNIKLIEDKMANMTEFCRTQ